MANNDTEIANTAAAAAPSGDQPRPQFNLLRQYLKDASVEFPASPQIFKDNQENSLNMEMNSSTTNVEPNIHEVVLQVSLNIVSPAKKTLMIIECKYAGIFEIMNVGESELDVLLNVHTLEILFPYVREIISSLSMRTSLPPILLPPTNFVQFYQQRLEKEKAEKAAAKAK